MIGLQDLPPSQVYIAGARAGLQIPGPDRIKCGGIVNPQMREVISLMPPSAFSSSMASRISGAEDLW